VFCNTAFVFFLQITIAIPGPIAPEGSYTVRLSNLALGGPVPFLGPFVPLFSVSTPQNDVGSGNYPGARYVVHFSCHSHVVQPLEAL
jgi:hypothetical protein